MSEHNAGMKVSDLYISQVKRKCGIEAGKNLHVKENAIVEALKHFKMIQQK